MKKFISLISSAALMFAVAIVPANAANITDVKVNGATTTIAQSAQVTTIAFTAPANVGNVVISYDADMVDAGFVIADVSVQNVATDIGATGIVVDTTANTISFSGDGASTADVVTVTLANAHFATPAAKQTISFGVVAGADLGAVVIPVDNGNQVVITATVEPILAMDIASTQVVYTDLTGTVLTVAAHHFKAGDSVVVKQNIASTAIGASAAVTVSTTVVSTTATTITLTAVGALTTGAAAGANDVIELASSSALGFGVLQADTLSSVAHDVVINTNATSGYTVQVANSANGLDEVANPGVNPVPASGADEDLSVGANYGYGINAAVDAGVNVDGKASEAGTIDAAFDGGAAVVSPMAAGAANLVVGAGVANQQRTTVNVQAKVSSLQEAGAYTDTITYTVTATF